MVKIQTPVTDSIIKNCKVGERILISGKIYCGRDAVLPKIAQLIKEGTLEKYNINLTNSVIFHTAVSIAGVGPTSSNKPELEGTMEILSKAGVKIFLGKGAISAPTIQMLNANNAIFAIIPPTTALLNEKTLSNKCVAFPELGMEAFYELEVCEYPAIIGAAQGKSIY